MKISDMHIWWRQFAQQMGMQNTRGILPEQIDLTINTAIKDTTNRIIRENVVNGANGVIDNTKIGQINAFKSLYKVAEIPFAINYNGTGNKRTAYGYFTLDPEYKSQGKLTNKIIENYLDVIPDDGYGFPKDILFIIDFSINYKDGMMGFLSGMNTLYSTDSEVTRYFPVRIIDDTHLSDTLNDAILKPRFNNPIIVTHDDGIYELYVGKFNERQEDDRNLGYFLYDNLLPYRLRFSYIAKPIEVHYDTNNNKCIDCNLPEYMHIDILKQAVDLWRISVTNDLHANNQQRQQNPGGNYNVGSIQQNR